MWNFFLWIYYVQSVRERYRKKRVSYMKGVGTFENICWIVTGQPQKKKAAFRLAFKFYKIRGCQSWMTNLGNSKIVFKFKIMDIWFVYYILNRVKFTRIISAKEAYIKCYEIFQICRRLYKFYNFTLEWSCCSDIGFTITMVSLRLGSDLVIVTYIQFHPEGSYFGYWGSLKQG